MLLDGFSLLTYWTHLGEYEQQCDESDLVSSTFVTPTALFCTPLSYMQALHVHVHM